MFSKEPGNTHLAHPIPARRPRLALIVFCICLCCGSGCTSNKPAPARFASVELQGNTPGQIHDAAVEVFQKHGYKVANKALDQIVFEKQGTKWDSFAYGDWDAPVWVRVKAAVVPLAEAKFRLQCHAYMVRDLGGTTEEEVACLRGAPYQKLMEEVAEHLHEGTAAAR